jgi:transcriptional regulator with XRE-family HTH domain
MQLAPDSPFLAGRPRLRNRVGKLITQEELAEHLGISRGWYARFEAGAPAGFSIPLLNRLGDILQLSAAERSELVRLAMPDLAPVVPHDSRSLYEALGVMRRAVKRLWSASSEAEILHVAGEEARQLLPCFDLIFARRVTAHDEAQFPRPGGTQAARVAQARACALRRLAPEQLVRVHALWQCAAGGSLVPIETYPPDCLRLYGLALDEHGLGYTLPVCAHIRVSIGPAIGSAIVGGTSARPRDVTEVERAMLSTIADFASLALH